MRLPKQFASLIVCWLLLALTAMGANVRWTGNAQDRAQVDTITVAGTWATGDTATLTINKKNLTVTIGAAVTPTDVAAALAAAVDASSATEDLVGTETRNIGGAEIPEFIEIDASSSGATLTITSATAGVPYTLTRSEVTAGDGTLGAVTSVTSATGKNWLSNADNYEGGALPADNDVLYFDSGAVPVLYDLGYFRTNSIDLDVIVSGDWTGQLGNPLQNPAGYQDYRTPRYFQFRGIDKTLSVIEGSSGVSGQGNLWIDLQDQTGVDVSIDARRGSGTAPTMFIAGAHATTLDNLLRITKGAVEIEPDDAPTATTKRAAFLTFHVGQPNGVETDTSVTIGRNARLSIPGTCTVSQLSGTIVSNAPTKIGTDEALVEIYGGVAHMRAGDHFEYALHGGTLYPSGDINSTIDEIRQFAGAVDFREAVYGVPIAKYVMYAGAALYDPAGHSVTAIDLVGCRPSQVTLELPTNRQIDLSAQATQ